jgi:hypothetical protein
MVMKAIATFSELARSLRFSVPISSISFEQAIFTHWQHKHPREPLVGSRACPSSSRETANSPMCKITGYSRPNYSGLEAKQKAK